MQSACSEEELRSETQAGPLSNQADRAARESASDNRNTEVCVMGYDIDPSSALSLAKQE